MKLLSIGKFAKLIGLSTAMLRRMHADGTLVPQFVSKGGTRYYTEEQLFSVKGDYRDTDIDKDQNHSDT